MRLCLDRMRGGLFHGKADPEGRPSACFAFHVDHASVVLNNAVHNSQSQARPLGLGGEERVEQFLHMLRRNSLSRIGNGNFTPVELIGRGLLIIRGDGDGASVPYGLACVQHQVPEHLAQLLGVSLDYEKRVRILNNVDPLAAAGTVLQKEDGLFYDRGERHPLLMRRPRPGIIQKFTDDRIEPDGFPENDIHEVFAVAFRVQFALEQLNGAAQGGERIADFMGNAGGKAPHGGQPLLSPDLLLHLDQIGDVLENEDDAAHRVPLVLEQRWGHSQTRRTAVPFDDLPFEPESPRLHFRRMAEKAFDACPEDVLNVLSDLVDGISDDFLGGRVPGRDPSVEVHGEDPAPDAPQNVLLNAPEVLKIEAFFPEFLARLAEPVRQVAAEKRDGIKGEDIDEDQIEHLHGGEILALHEPGDIIVLHVEHASVENARQGRRQKPSAAVQDNARGDDGQVIKNREAAVDPSGQIDEKRYQKDIARDLSIGEERKVPAQRKQIPVYSGQNKDRQEAIVQIGNGKRVDAVPMLKKNEGDEHEGKEYHPADHQPLDAGTVFVS